jgi:integrase
LAESFGPKGLREIAPFHVEAHKQHRIQAGARIRVNRELAVLKALFYRCQDWGVFEGDNPVRRVKFVKEPRQRLRYLEAEEEQRLLYAATEPLRTMILLGIHTGLRLHSEALTLKWPDITCHAASSACKPATPRTDRHAPCLSIPPFMPRCRA